MYIRNGGHFAIRGDSSPRDHKDGLQAFRFAVCPYTGIPGALASGLYAVLNVAGLRRLLNPDQ